MLGVGASPLPILDPDPRRRRPKLYRLIFSRRSSQNLRSAATSPSQPPLCRNHLSITVTSPSLMPLRRSILYVAAYNASLTPASSSVSTRELKIWKITKEYIICRISKFHS